MMPRAGAIRTLDTEVELMPIFDPEIVHRCSMECLGLPKPQMFDVFAQSLAKHYPKILDFKQPWIYSIAGGAMMQIKLYYASMTEYIMIWGTPIGSEGHSGRHCTGFWDTVIDGEMWYYGEGEFEKKGLQAWRPRLRGARPGARHELHRRGMGGGVRSGLHPVEHAVRHRAGDIHLLRLLDGDPDRDPLHRPGGPGCRAQSSRS